MEVKLVDLFEEAEFIHMIKDSQDILAINENLSNERIGEIITENIRKASTPEEEVLT